jgi:hypothetical protein
LFISLKIKPTVPLAWIKSMQVKRYAFFNIYLN